MNTMSMPISLDANKFVKESTADITYYVRTSGNDNNDGLTLGTALRQVNAAIGKLPTKIKHSIDIDIGAGSFESFAVDSLIMTNNGNLNIFGTMELSTLASGVNNGTFDTSTDYIGVDNSQTWTNSDLINRFVKVDNTYYALKKNNISSLEIMTRKYGGFTGKSYTIEDPQTIITTSAYEAMVLINNIIGLNSLVVKQMRLENMGNGYGLSIENCSHGFFRTMQIINPFPWGLMAFRSNFISLVEICITNPYWGGCNIGKINELNPYGIYVKDGGGNTWAGVDISYVNALNGLAAFVDNNNGGSGISLRSCSYINVVNNGIECNNNATHGLYVDNGFMAATNHNDYKGSGNGGHGMVVGHGCYGVVKTGVNITGSAGDCLLGGVNVAWSDLVSDGDKISNPAYNNSIRRADYYE